MSMLLIFHTRTVAWARARISKEGYGDGNALLLRCRCVEGWKNAGDHRGFADCGCGAKLNCDKRTIPHPDRERFALAANLPSPYAVTVLRNDDMKFISHQGSHALQYGPRPSRWKGKAKTPAICGA